MFQSSLEGHAFSSECFRMKKPSNDLFLSRWHDVDVDVGVVMGRSFVQLVFVSTLIAFEGPFINLSLGSPSLNLATQRRYFCTSLYQWSVE